MWRRSRKSLVMSWRALHHYLHNQSQGQHDSQGEFTLNSQEALRKLSRYQMLGPGLGLTKLVQAGVRLGAAEIRMSFQAQSAILRFYESSPVDGGELGSSLMAGELPDESWKRHLVSGLRALINLDPQQLSWVDSRGRQTDLGVSDEYQRIDPLSSTFTVYVRLPQPQGLARWIARSPFELSLMAYHCQMCHIPIRVNEECISRRFPPRHQARQVFAGKPIVLALDTADGRFLPLTITDLGRLDQRLSCLPPPRLEPHRVGALAILSEGVFPGGDSYCYWLQDGALLHPRRLDFRFQSKTFSRFHLSLYLDGRDVKVDLSEFKPVAADVDFIPIQTQLRRLVQKLDLTSRPHRQPGWQPKARAAEDQRALLESVDWLRFASRSHDT